MSRFVAGVVASTLLLGITAAPAAAQKQDIKTRGYFGVGGGVSAPVGDFKDGAKTGFAANLLGGFTTRGGIFGARAALTWAQNGDRILDGNHRMIGLDANVVLTPGHRPNNFHPYFLAGAGLYNVHSGGGTGVASHTETKPAFNVGVGLQIHTGHQTDIFVEGRYLNIRTSGNSSSLVPITFGLRWGGI